MNIKPLLIKYERYESLQISSKTCIIANPNASSLWIHLFSALTEPDHPRYMTNPPCNTFLAAVYDHKAKIPGWGESIWISNPTIDSDEDLKKAIMDYGPIILYGS